MMGESSTVDPLTQKAISEAVEKERKKIREENSARTRHYMEVLGFLGIVGTLVAFSSVGTMINNAVEASIDDATIKKIHGRAKAIIDDLEDMKKKAETELAGPGIEIYRYSLNLPSREGRYFYDTEISKTKFDAALAVGGKFIGCASSDAKISVDRADETWQITFFKPQRCSLLDVWIVYGRPENVQDIQGTVHIKR